MINKVHIAVLVLGCSLALAQASLKAEETGSNLLPTVDVAKEKSLDLDDESGSGGLDELYADDEYDEDDDYDYDEEDEEDEEYYDDDDDDDDPDWSLYNEASGDDTEEEYEDDDAIETKEVKDSDWHFADSVADNNATVDDLLYEYYAEEYEEDYDMSSPEVTTPEVVEDTPSRQPTSLVSSNLLVYVFVASGLVSFAIFTLAFVLCYWQRRTSTGKASTNLPFVIDVSTMSHPGSHSRQPPPSSIVKSYHRVPTSTKEFLSSNGMENSSHVLNSSGQSQQDSSEKPLLP